MTHQDPFRIRPARAVDAPILADIMTEEINWGRLRHLGNRFITTLHRHMINSNHAVCFVAERDGEIIGYGAGVADISKFYRQFLWRYGIIASVTLLPKLVQPQQFKTIVRGFTYFPDAHPDDPKAEIISFAVRSKTKKSGVRNHRNQRRNC